MNDKVDRTGTKGTAEITKNIAIIGILKTIMMTIKEEVKVKCPVMKAPGITTEYGESIDVIVNIKTKAIIQITSGKAPITSHSSIK